MNHDWNRVARGFAGLVTALAVLSCGGGNDGPTSPDGALRVLFIGNSLTYSNDLPGMVTALAEASGTRPIVTESVSLPNFALVDHFTMSNAADRVRDGHFDVVVLQQGPSSLLINRDSLRLMAADWAVLIRAAGGRPALYAVWPDESRFFAFPDVNLSYQLAAQDVDGLFFPVGDTWIETWNLMPAADLYDADRFHPGVAGSYAAAVVMVSVLTGRQPTSLERDFRLANGLPIQIESGVASAIQTAAETVLGRVGTQTPP